MNAACGQKPPRSHGEDQPVERVGPPIQAWLLWLDMLLRPDLKAILCFRNPGGTLSEAGCNRKHTHTPLERLRDVKSTLYAALQRTGLN